MSIVWLRLTCFLSALGLILTAKGAIAASQDADADDGSTTATAEVSPNFLQLPLSPHRLSSAIPDQPSTIPALERRSLPDDLFAGGDSLVGWEAEEEMGQVTSVSQLSDVEPSDWAYEALQSLVERYGVIAGYPNGTYRGNRSLTRYEFAAGLNAALERIDELIAAGLEEQVSGEEFATLQRLQEEFSAELATVRGRLNNLEARTAELEANQFSTTTRLTGDTVFAINGGIQAGVPDPSTVFISRVRLNLETSLTGEDLLLTQLQFGSGNENDDAAEFLLRSNGEFRDDLIEAGNEITDRALGQVGASLENFPRLRLNNQESVEAIRDRLAVNLQGLAQRAGLSPQEAQDIFDTVSDAVETAEGINGFLQTNSALDYSEANNSAVLNRLSYTFSPFEDFNLSLFARGYASDYVDFNQYANESTRDFSTYGLINNQLLLANDPPGAGAAISWNPGNGFFTLRAVYRAERAAIASRPSSTSNQNGLFGDPYLGIVELGFTPSDDLTINLQYSGGAQGDNEYDVVGANLQWRLGRHLGAFGRFGYAFNFPGGIQPTSWSAGIAVSDLFVPGTLAGIGVGQPLIFEEDVVNFFDSTQTNFEAFYKLPLNDNLSITPVLQLITNPGNRSGNAIFTGTLRTVFFF